MRDFVLLHVNGERHEVRGREAFLTLSSYLRYEKGKIGTKIVCEEGDCGACTVLLGEKPVNSCIQFVFQLDGMSVTTVEGLRAGDALTPVQDAMVRNHGAQCGFCTPGFVVAMTALVSRGSDFDERDVRDALTGNLCRCTGYEPIIKAALDVAARTAGPPKPEARERPDSMRVEHEGRVAFAPETLDEAIRFKAEHPDAIVIQGATDLGVLANKRGMQPKAMLLLSKIPALDDLTNGNGMLVVGARVTLSRLEDFTREAIPEFHRILTLFGSPQIRNAGTLAGNIGNGSPIADTLPFLFVMDAEIEVAGPRGSRLINMNRLYKAYKKLDIAADELITRILIPLPRPDETLKLYKVSKRRDLDISTFTAAIRLKSNGNGIESPRIAYGGVAATVVRLPRTEEFLEGKPFELATFERAGEIARSEVNPISDVRGSAEYRSQLAENILTKFYHDVSGEAVPGSRFQVPGSEKQSAGTRNLEPGTWSSVGKNIPHDSARGHVTGESLYIDDIPLARNELVVDFYWSHVAHGRIRSLDLDAARSVPGVVGLFTHRDLHSNLFGPILEDELLLAEEEITFIGQPIVVIAAENRDAIRAAKNAIRIDIEELEPVLTIDDAIAKKLLIGEPRFIRRGDLQKGFADAEHVLEGTLVTGGQDHFYLESQAAIAYPEEHGSIVIHSSTQNPSEVQEVLAHLLGLRLNQVVCITKRMGGAFGGKECQATHPAAIAALVAHKTKRPARIVYSKDDDMIVTGKRHPFQNRYRVGFQRDGVITALAVELYSDGGAFADLSPAVMGRAMTHVDNAYFIPNIEIQGTICRTNNASNTAFRGFGGPQGVATIENIIEEIAAYLQRDAYEIRRTNCYDGTRNTTPYGEVVANNMLPRLFDDCAARADYRQRAAAVKVFNAASTTHLKGIALTAVKFGISFNTTFLNQANALVNLYLDGTVQVSTGATEMGQGVNTKLKQLVADELGIDASRVIVMITSTEKNNNTSATAASSAADLNGSAAVDACRRIRERLATCAFDTLKASDVVFENGFVFEREKPDNRLKFEELIKIAYHRRISLGERGFYSTKGIDWDAVKGMGSPFLYYTMGCAASEVLIDRFTGAMRVLRSDLLMDIGKPINPGIDRGQITGAFIQGMGWLTTEELKYSEKGELLSHSPTTYKIPNIQDVPETFNVDWIDNPDNTVNLRGSKAVGEPPLLLALSVWCAVKHALSFVANGDVPKLRIPATGEEILMRIAEYRKRKAPVAISA